MPIYEFECIVHGIFEVLLPRLPDEEEHRCTWESGQRQCTYLSPLVFSRVVMRPDNLWSGQMTQHGYMTSSSKLARIRKAANIEVLGDQKDVEAMKATAAKARAAWDEKLDRETKEAFETAFAGTGVVDAFGELRPEAVDTWRNDRIHEDSAKIS